jgi:hypothetical protein
VVEADVVTPISRTAAEQLPAKMKNREMRRIHIDFPSPNLRKHFVSGTKVPRLNLLEPTNRKADPGSKSGKAVQDLADSSSLKLLEAPLSF